MGAIETFIEELRAEPALSGHANQFEAAFKASRIEAAKNKHANNFLAALRLIVQRQDKSLVERFDAILKLTAFKGPVVGSVSKLVGWA
ncbi:hypothetical protein [Bradyrhizobium guangdongense]|uniref:Uncharacterized protein n=1 Tax=Bradyrhizobium guangdongense TaxID=1325090 RepID=A0A410V700_9BRAD|nr:hypothetical protein [Bradyrhizobium guangdongense]QAU39445.1 hypothetical protein X265_18585 [Bradyrhizobium guangdongense]QOZ60504.1 hypothetical protein XH86_18590 [Bradyrhizobium guangdongense]GGI23793.1 hypothetical protein GCM10010987_26160 [Bradyrhizobium guangdongense]